MRRILAFLITVVVLIGTAVVFVNAEESENTLMNQSEYGFHVESDGTITVGGKAFYGFGLNYFGAFCHSYYADGTPDYVAGFAAVRENNLPFVRLPLCGYYPDYYDWFDEDTDYMLQKMKAVIDCAWENNVGVIVSLMWWDPAIAAHVGGKRSDMGVEGSAVLEYCKKYTEIIVSTFADHPAVWGWEIGNEYNLNADLCDSAFKNFLWDANAPGMSLDDVNGYDYYTSTELVYFYTEIAKVIRKYDTYRMIETGNGEMRTSALAMYKAAKKANKKHLWNINWAESNYKQFLEINAIYTPDPIDTMCFHLQHGTGGSATPAYELEFNRFSKKVSSLEYFKAYADAAKSVNKGLIFGEFGDMRDMESDENCLDTFDQVCGWILEAGIQVAASWQFQDYTEEGNSGAKIDIMGKYNKQLQNDGLQDLSGVWQEYKPYEIKKYNKESTTAEITAEENTTVGFTEITAAEATSADDVTTSEISDDETKQPEKTGCGASISTAALAASITALAAGMEILKKKKET